MRVSADLAGRALLVVGRADRCRRAVARYVAAGAQVRVVADRDAVAALDVPPFAAGTPDAVAWVEGAPELLLRLRALAPRHRIVLLADDPVEPTPRGHVTLVGGGPGDSGLLTVAALRALAEADVVLHDRLAPRHVIGEYAPGAELVDVGKSPLHHAVPQGEIERLLVEHAGRGLRVVRLKGGDPFVFGRGGEEVLACRRAGVPVTVVPGVSSAVSVPASAGIPVTHRGVARAFTVVSGHVPLGEDELAHLAGLGGTIVVLMGVATLHHLVAGLLRHGLGASTPIALLEKGFSVEQHALVATLGTVEEAVLTRRPASPCVIVVGEVVGAAGPVGWGLDDLLGQDGVTSDAVVAPVPT